MFHFDLVQISGLTDKSCWSMTIDPRARTVILKATEAGENHLRFESTMASYS